MIRRADFTASDANGTPEPGVYITVKTNTGALATLFNDNGSSLSNPFQSGTLGAFVYNVATEGVYTEEYRLSLADSPRKIIELELSLSGLDGLLVNAPSLIVPIGTDMVATVGADALDHGGANYVAGTAPTARSGFTSANARNFTLSKEETVTPQKLYLATDPDDHNSVQGALDYLVTSALSGHGYGSGTAPLTIPKASALYNMGTTPIDLNYTTRISGEGVGGTGGWATALKWGAGSHGYRIQYYHTSGDTATGSTVPGGSASVIEKQAIQGGYAGTEGEFHGIFARATFSGRELNIWDFQGDGIHIHAASGLPESGNANNWDISKAWIQNTRNGLWVDGSDSNQGIATEVSVSSARQWGFYDHAGSGNLYVAPLTQLCGLSTNDGTAGKPVSVVTQGGQRYAVKIGQEVGASTNSPNGLSGIGTGDNTWWYWYETGGVSVNHPAWFSGIALRAGGPYNMTGGQLIVLGYAEGGQPPCQFGGDVLRLCGNWGNRVIGGAFLYANSNQVQINDLHVVAGGIQFDDDQSGTLTVGRYSSGLHTAFIKCSTAASDLAIRSPGNTGGISVADASITVTAPFGYGAGVGGAVTQLTSKSTATPAINKSCGQVTMNNAALAAGAKVSFAVTNSTVAATDTIIVSVASGGTANAYRAAVTAISAGASFTITVENITAGSLSEAPVVNFAIIKAVAA